MYGDDFIKVMVLSLKRNLCDILLVANKVKKSASVETWRLIDYPQASHQGGVGDSGTLSPFC